nr:hypothetical protein [Listeria riparia]
MIQTNRHGNQLTLTWSPTDILAGSIIFQSNTAAPTSSKKKITRCGPGNKACTRNR